MSAPQPGDLVSVTYVARYDERWNEGHNLTHEPSGWDLQAPPGAIVKVLPTKAAIGTCSHPECGKDAGAHGWCVDHRCGSRFSETKFKGKNGCEYEAGHGGRWHDNGGGKWLTEAALLEGGASA